jgi:hypothetical protein
VLERFEAALASAVIGLSAGHSRDLRRFQDPARMEFQAMAIESVIDETLMFERHGRQQDRNGTNGKSIQSR